MNGPIQTMSLYWCKIQQIDGLVALIFFLYYVVEFSWVGCMIAATCKLKFKIIGMFSLTSYFFNSYHLVYGGSFLTSFSLFMLALIKPDHFYQVRMISDWLGINFLLHPIPEFPCAGSGFWSGLRHVIRPKLCSGFTLFQKETSFGFDLCGSRLFTRYLDPAHPAKQPIISSWIRQNDTIQRSVGHIFACDSLHPYACSSIPYFDITASYDEVDSPNL